MLSAAQPTAPAAPAPSALPPALLAADARILAAAGDDEAVPWRRWSLAQLHAELPRARRNADDFAQMRQTRRRTFDGAPISLLAAIYAERVAGIEAAITERTRLAEAAALDSDER